MNIDEIDNFGNSDSHTLLHDEIREYMKTQSQISQDIFYLRLDGYSFKEIAERLIINPNSAKVIQHRNKKCLKEILKRGDGYEG